MVPDWGNDYPLRFHEAEGKRSWALFSPCEQYRYRLRREWGEGASLCYVMLNPSKANEISNDPTVERCERRARALGYGAFEVVNIFAWRSTDPKQLYTSRDPIGEGNDSAIAESVASCTHVLAAWGAHGALNGRGQIVQNTLPLERSFHLGLTKKGEPKHPLYISYAQELIAYL